MTTLRTSRPAPADTGGRAPAPRNTVIPRNTRLALIDRADLMGVSDTTLRCFMQYLRATKLHRWNTCAEFADTLGITHHQARPVVAELVHAGLLERTVNPHRLRDADQRLTAYRVIPSAIEQRPSKHRDGER